jgi:diguanylate cyclase (GGDEF)-like protein/PAS domain S-box-containing protein
MLVSDLNGIWTFTNLALQEMLGYTAEELSTLSPGGPSRPEDWKESESQWRELLAGAANSYNGARSFQHKDGHLVWVHEAVSLLRDEDGMPVHFVAQIESLEARRSAEERLAQEREHLRVTLQSINDPVITTDASTRITYINAAAEDILGLTFKAAERRRVDEIVHLIDPKSSRSAVSLIAQCVLNRKVMRREQFCALQRPDGAVRYVQDVVSPLTDAAGLLSGLVIVFHDATPDVDRAMDLQHRASHDSLTGLCNRAEFEQQISATWAKARHLGLPAAIVAIDLDRFKAVNDAAGHAAGDALLCKVAEVCRHAVRSSDTVARLGGDEFAIILDKCSAERARSIAERILRVLNPLQFEWQGTAHRIGASVGLAMSAPDLPDEFAWLKAADQACYAAKAGGRGQLREATFDKSTERS